MKLLHIDSSIMGNDSITRELSADIVAHIQASHKGVHLKYRDLAKDEVRHLSGPIAAGFRQTGISNIPAETVLEHQLSETLVTEFLDSDILIIGAPMYNFSVSTQLKAWLDRIAQVGRTFKYTEQGPIGLCSGKRIIIFSARGGFYAEGPFQKMDFQESYLTAFFGFLGIKHVDFIRAEGASKGEQIRNSGVALAKSEIPIMVASLSVDAS